MRTESIGVDSPLFNDWDIEGIEPNRRMAFVKKVKKARELYKLPPIDSHTLIKYCEVLINGATIATLIGTAHCCEGFDLVDSDEMGGIPASNELLRRYEVFSKHYLGLELLAQGNDPRGASFKLVVDPALGDSFGDREHLCVPAVDAYTVI